MRKIILACLGVALIVAAVFGAIAIVANKKQPKPKAEKLIKTVFVDTVRNTTVPIRISAQGNLLAKRRVALFSEVQGIFKTGAKAFKTGQAYQKGKSLIRIDASEYYATVQAAKSKFYNLMTSIMPDLQLDYPEIFDKWEQYVRGFEMEKTVPDLPLTNSDKEKYFITGRGVYSTYYDVKNLEQRLAKYTIYAPFDGILSKAVVTEGTLIRPGQELGTFIQTGVYEMEIAMSKEYAHLLKVDAAVTLVDRNNAEKFQGKVVRVNGSIDQATQTITVFVEVRNAALKEGMYLEATLDAKEEPDAISIDRGLLQPDNRVFVVRGGMLNLIDVQPVFFSDKKVVVKGIPSGLLLVSKNVPGAYDGMLVRIYNAGEESDLEQQKPDNAAL